MSSFLLNVLIYMFNTGESVCEIFSEWGSSLDVETHLFPGASASDAGHLTLGRKALIIRYMLRTLRFIEKSQSVSSQSRMVP